MKSQDKRGEAVLNASFYDLEKWQGAVHRGDIFNFKVVVVGGVLESSSQC